MISSSKETWLRTAKANLEAGAEAWELGMTQHASDKADPNWGEANYCPCADPDEEKGESDAKSHAGR